MTDKVLAFKPKSEAELDTHFGFPHEQTIHAVETNIGSRTNLLPKMLSVNDDEKRTLPSNPVPIDALYPLPLASSPELSSALRLLAEGIVHAEAAIDTIEEGDIIAADDSINHLEVIMPELFCCRALGDGYGSVINALMSGIRNRKAQPLNNIQIRMIWLALKQLRAEPFIRLEKAFDLIEKIESTGLNLDPVAFEHLVGWIDE